MLSALNKPDPKLNQKKGMGINPPVVTITVMQNVHSGKYNGDQEIDFDSDDDEKMLPSTPDKTPEKMAVAISERGEKTDKSENGNENGTPKKMKQLKRSRQSSEVELRMDDLNQMTMPPRRRMQTANDRVNPYKKPERMASASGLALPKSASKVSERRSQDFP